MHVSASDPDTRWLDACRGPTHKPYSRHPCSSHPVILCPRFFARAGFPRWGWRGAVIRNDLDFASWHYVALRYQLVASMLIIIDYIVTTVFPPWLCRNGLANGFSLIPDRIILQFASLRIPARADVSRGKSVGGYAFRVKLKRNWIRLTIFNRSSFMVYPRSLRQNNCVFLRLCRRIKHARKSRSASLHVAESIRCFQDKSNLLISANEIHLQSVAQRKEIQTLHGMTVCFTWNTI